MLYPILLLGSLATPNDSPTWVATDSTTRESLRGLSAVDGFVCWASGAKGTVLRTMDGVTWEKRPVPGAEELDFRDIEAFDENNAVIVSAGAPARVYRTADGGATWQLVYENEDERAFFDAMDFWDTERGLAFSDPLDGKLLVIATTDGGASWTELSPERFPDSPEGEAGFAASGTCLATGGTRDAWIGTGGTNGSRVFRTSDGGETWTASPTPLLSESNATGIFSLALLGEGRGIAVGGDYTKSGETRANAAWTDDGGATWHAVNDAAPSGYRSCVAARPGTNGMELFCAGPNGCDLSTDGGESWRRFSDEGFHSLSFGSDGALWASGADGRIAKLSGPVMKTARWDRYRGPNGSGVSEGGELPAQIGPDTNVLWKTDVGEGFSSPILSAKHAFLTSADEEHLYTHAIDRATGEIVWTRETPRMRKTQFHPKNGPASPSAAVDGDAIVVFFDEYGLVAYGHDGSGRWRVPLGPFNNVYGMGISPVIADDVVVLGCDQMTDSFVIGVSKTTGRELWRVDRPNAISGSCTPVIREAGGRTEVLLPGSFLLDAYDARTGKRIWWFNGMPAEMKSVPVLVGDTLWIHGNGSPMNDLGNQVSLPAFADAVKDSDANESGKIEADEIEHEGARRYTMYCDIDGDKAMNEREWELLRASMESVNAAIAMKVGGEGDITESALLWRYYRNVPQLPSPLIYEDVYYMLDDRGGLVTTLSPTSGEKIDKGRLKDAADNYFASPVASDGKVWFLSEAGLLTVLDAKKGFEAIHSADFAEPCFATPAIEDARIYLRAGKYLYCFGI